MKSSSRYPFNVTKSVAGSCGECETLLTHLSCGKPFDVDSHELPPSLLTQTFPSSVPTQSNPNFNGDSAKQAMVEIGTLPCVLFFVKSVLIASSRHPYSCFCRLYSQRGKRYQDCVYLTTAVLASSNATEFLLDYVGA